MSALICVFNRDTEPVEPGVSLSMLESLEHHGPDGANHVLLGPVALGIQRFNSLPEDVSCVQPLVDQEAGIAFVFEGRLDNREELSTLLDCPHPVSRADAELAANAYARWGEDAFKKMIGSFVLVAVHLRDRRVVMARDALGDRTLYYLLDHRRLLIASEPCALLRHPSVRKKENPAHVAAYFNLEWPADGSSVMEGIEELLPGHYLAVARGLLRELAKDHDDLKAYLARVNAGLAASVVQGTDQFVKAGILLPANGGVEWVGAGGCQGAVIRRNGVFEEFTSHGPPLGMMEGFQFATERMELGAGDAVIVLSDVTPGVFRGAADLVATLQGKPAGEVVSTLHKALAKAQPDVSVEASALFIRKQ